MTRRANPVTTLPCLCRGDYIITYYEGTWQYEPNMVGTHSGIHSFSVHRGVWLLHIFHITYAPPWYIVGLFTSSVGDQALRLPIRRRIQKKSYTQLAAYHTVHYLARADSFLIVCAVFYGRILRLSDWRSNYVIPGTRQRCTHFGQITILDHLDHLDPKIL